MLLEDDCNHAEGGAVSDAGAVEEHDEHEHEGREEVEVLLAVVQALARLPAEDAARDGREGLNDGVHLRHERAAELVAHVPADGANQRADRRSDPGVVQDVGGVGVDGAVGEVAEEVLEELGERAREPDEGAEGHDVEVRHHVVVLVAEDDGLVDDLGLDLRGDAVPDERVHDDDGNDDEHDDAADGVAGRVERGGDGDGGGDEDARGDARGEHADGVKPEPLEHAVGHADELVGRRGHVGHAASGHGDGDGAEDGVEGAGVASPGTRTRGGTAERRVAADGADEELRHGDAEVAEAGVETEREALLALGEEQRDVVHGRGEGSAADAGERRADDELGEGRVLALEDRRRPDARDEERHGGAHDGDATAGDGDHEGVDAAHDTAGETGDGGDGVEDGLVVVPGLDPAAEVVGGAVHRGVAGSHARRLGRVVRLLNDHDGGGPHEPDCETEEEVGNGADQVAIGDRLALFGVEDVVLGIPVVELECAIDELAGA